MIKNLKRPKLFFVALSLGVVLGFGGTALALSRNKDVSGNSNHSLYEFGQTVDINGNVNGDVICAAQTVNINATVSGDVLCAAQSVNISGQVDGSVRVAAQTVDLSAKVSGGASVAAQDFNLRSDASVGRDLSLLTESATLDGSVKRDVQVLSGSVTLNNQIGRNFSGHVNKLTLGSGARLNGNLNYSSAHKLIRKNGSVVLGSISYTRSRGTHHAFGWLSGWAWRFVLAVGLVVFSLVLVALFPGLFRRVVGVSRSRFWFSLLTGIVSFILLPAIMLALTFTIIGWPLAVLTGLVWAAVLMLSLPVSAYLLGSLTGQSKHGVLIMLIGVVILAILLLIPYVNIVAAILAVLVGSGSLLLDLKNYFKKPVYT